MRLTYSKPPRQGPVSWKRTALKVVRVYRELFLVGVLLQLAGTSSSDFLSHQVGPPMLNF